MSHYPDTDPGSIMSKAPETAPKRIILTSWAQNELQALTRELAEVSQETSELLHKISDLRGRLRKFWAAVSAEKAQVVTKEVDHG
jgi:hypothetical protein